MNLTQSFLLGDTPQQETFLVAVRKKQQQQLRFSENLNKLFPTADMIFNDQKIELDDDNMPNMK